MKKLSALVGLALVMLTTGCSKDATFDINPSLKTTLGVSLEQTRTYIGDVDAEGTYPVLWSQDDMVSVNKTSVVVDQAYVGKNYFAVEVAAADEYCVAYPAQYVKDDVLTVSEVQKFVDSSFAVNSGVMVGYSTTEEVKMKNLYGYLKFTVNSAADVNAVTVTTTGGEPISGTYRLDYKNATIDALAGKDIIRVTDVQATNGTATVIVAVPAGKYSKGFTVTIKDKNNGIMTKSLKGAGATVEAGVIYAMPALAYAKEDAEVLIMNADDLLLFVTAANSADGYAAWTNTDGEVKLGADIDLTGVTLPQITKFTGIFNGQGFALKNWTTTLAFIGELADGATLKNLVVDKSCTLTPDLTAANTHIGYMVGIGRGLVTGCVNNADLKISGEYNRSDSCRFGCMVASAYSRIRNCVNNGNLEINFSTVNQAIYAGGISGYYNPESGRGQGEEYMQDCINNGNVKVVSQGVPSNAYVGGIYGSTPQTKLSTTNPSCEGTVIRCINTGDVYYEMQALGSGTYANIGGIIGYSQTHIKECENYGTVTYKTPVSTEVGASRPAVGGITASTQYSLIDCVNYGEIIVEGTWTAASSDGLTAVGGQKQPNFGGIVGSIGHYDDRETTQVLSGCTNYGKLTLKPHIPAAAGTYHYMGGVGGYVAAAVSDCHNYGEIFIESNGLYSYMGGVVGFTRTVAPMSNCTNNAKVTINHDISGTQNTQVLATESPKEIKSFYGGVVGYGCADVSNCHNYGAATVYSNTRAANLGGVAGYVTSNGDISDCSNNAANTYYITYTAHVLSGYVGNPKHYIGGVVGDAAGNMIDCTNETEGTLTVHTSARGEFGGVVGYSGLNCTNLINKAPITLKFSYDGKICDKQSWLGAVIGYNHNTDKENLITIGSCRNSGKLVVEDLACVSAFTYVGGVIGSNETNGLTGIEDCHSTGDIEVDAPTTVRLGGVAGYAGKNVTGCSYNGNIKATRMKYNTASRMASIGGLVGYTVWSIIDSTVDCTINANGDSGICVGGVMGTSGTDTWKNLTAKVDITTSSEATLGLLLGGEVADDPITVNLGTADAPVTIKKSSKLNGTQIKADGTDVLSGMETAIVKVVNVKYAD